MQLKNKKYKDKNKSLKMIFQIMTLKKKISLSKPTHWKFTLTNGASTHLTICFHKYDFEKP